MRPKISETLLLLLPVLVALLAPLSLPATAGAVECHGQPATLVDLDGGDVTGTEGDDVVVATGQSNDPSVSDGVYALGGNDTVCVNAGIVNGGPGRDFVQVASSNERLYLRLDQAEDLDVTLGTGGGDLLLNLSGRGAGTVDLGPDGGMTVYGRTLVQVDLEDDLLTIDGGTYTLLGDNPPIVGLAKRVELTGDKSDNYLAVVQHTCDEIIEGGRGDDTLFLTRGDGDQPLPKNCERGPSRLHGQRGNDFLQGRRGPDILVGGAGRDEARGGYAFDICRAELEKQCER